MKLLQRKFVCCLLLISLGYVPAPAQQTGPPTCGLAIKAGKLLDVRTGKISPNVVILIENDRIVSLADSAPAGVPVIDLSNQTVLPGLIDAHVHLLFNWKDQSSASVLRMSSPQGALWGAYNLRTYLNQGFTTVRDACEYDAAYGQFALRDSVKIGLVQGPRVVAAGSCISVTGGPCPGRPVAAGQGPPPPPQ